MGMRERKSKKWAYTEMKFICFIQFELLLKHVAVVVILRV